MHYFNKQRLVIVKLKDPGDFNFKQKDNGIYGSAKSG